MSEVETVRHIVGRSVALVEIRHAEVLLAELHDADEGMLHLGDVSGLRIWAEHQARHARAEAKLRAFDKKTGELLSELQLPENITGALMTFAVGKKQYIVFPVGGLFTPDELIAVSLPD